MEEAERLKRIAQRWEQGLLPREVPSNTWGGPCLAVQACVACGSTIVLGESEIEARYPSGRSLVLHVACFSTLQSLQNSASCRPPKAAPDPGP